MSLNKYKSHLVGKFVRYTTSIPIIRLKSRELDPSSSWKFHKNNVDSLKRVSRQDMLSSKLLQALYG